MAALRTTSSGRCHPGTVRRLKGNGGFTLVELGLVLLIMGILAGLIMPRFQDRSHAELVSHARRLAVTMRHLRNEAILGGRTYRLFYDLTEHRYWAAVADETGEQLRFVRQTDSAGRGVTLPEPVGFTDVVMPLTAGKVAGGVAFTDFYPDGYVDLTVIHLDNGDEGFTLRVEPLTGNVYVTSGYQDFDFSA